MSNEKLTRREIIQDGAAMAAGLAISLRMAGAADTPGTQPAAKPKILNYNPNMEYRRLGKSGLMISAISLGGHWKQCPYRPGTDDFKKNRHDVVSACIEAGINCIDACTGGEVVAYAEALRGRRDKMYISYSWYEHEMRFEPWQKVDRLLEGLNEGLKASGLDYVDIWRITCYEPGGKHTPAHEEMTIKALEAARKAGKARFIGFSSHDRAWLNRMVQTHPQVDMILTPFSIGTKRKPEDSMFDTLKKHDVGMLGIKPFSSGAVFQSRGAINPATQEKDDEQARMSLRYVLRENVLTAAIPGMISTDQVKNAAKAVTERRQFDKAEALKFEQAVKDMWANLPEEYQWLKEWEWV